MIRLQTVEALGRKMRQDDVAELAVPTWTLIREAIQEQRNDKALDLVDYSCYLEEAASNSSANFVEILLTHIASYGEEEVEKIIRQRSLPMIKNWLSATPGVMESLQRCAEIQRGHHGNFTITEEKERYVVRYDPCGTGGKLRRTREVGTTKKAYPWSCSKAGVPYYCTHCIIQYEIIPIELRGYPIRINLIGDNPVGSCEHLLYKNPELIPEEYFSRVGKTKKIR